MANLRLNDEIFGELLPYIKEDNVTDINWNGSALWLNDLNKGRYCVENFKLDDKFIDQFTARLSNLMNSPFNKTSPLLEAETDGLRVSIIHESVAAIRRLNKQKMKETDYCPDMINNFLENCVKARLNIVVCGLPGTGKTELLKALTAYVPANQRAITIEDNLEIRYSEINPGKDCVSLKVDKDFDYTAAIKACLRQLPDWIMVAEARSTEVKYLLESMSTGTNCLTTLHTDSVLKIPARIKNMLPEVNDQIENNIYSYINVGIQVRSYINEDGITRRIAEVALFSGANEKNKMYLLYDYEDGGVVDLSIPKDIMYKFRIAGIYNPFKPYSIQSKLKDEYKKKHTKK